MRRAPLHGARVLDIGCGDGRLTLRIAGVVRSAMGVDPDAEQIERAKRLLPVRLRGKIRFEVGYAEPCVSPNRSFDAVIFSWSL
jgi:ubiquinone/menaquinone biosynthesis C-methylase UbiE